MKQKSSDKEQQTSSKGDSIVPFIPFAIIMNTIFQGMGGVVATAARETLWHKSLVEDYDLLKDKENIKNIKSLKIYKIIQKKYNIDRYLIAIFIIMIAMISVSFFFAKQWSYCVDELDLSKIISFKNYIGISGDLNCLNKYSLLLFIFSFLFIPVTSIFWQKRAFLGNIKSYVILMHQRRWVFVAFNSLIVFLIILSGIHYYHDFVTNIFLYDGDYSYKKYLTANITPMILLFVTLYCINAGVSLLCALFLYKNIRLSQTLKEGYES